VERRAGRARASTSVSDHRPCRRHGRDAGDRSDSGVGAYNESSDGQPQHPRGVRSIFLSFFWEAQDRDNWPIYHPASREGLERFGLVTLPGDPTDAYLAFRGAMKHACDVVGADVWNLAQFFWGVKESASPAVDGSHVSSSGAPAPSSGTATDLYAFIAAAGLTFPEALVTTFVLSLLSKRFVILAGISGTGKTQLPLQLAQYLSTLSPGATVAEPVPESDERTLYLLVRQSSFKYGVLTIPRRVVDFIELPDRGTGTSFTVRLPTGQDGSIRIQNVGFADESAQHARITSEAPRDPG